MREMKASWIANAVLPIVLLCSEAPAEPLTYRLVDTQDISYPGKQRRTYRIVFDVAELPTEAQLRETVRSFWKNDKTGFDEVTVWGYLPEMDPENIAYVVSEFTPNGLKSFKLNNFAAYGTKWWQEVTAAEARANEKDSLDSEKIDYGGSLKLTQDDRTVALLFMSDLPESTLVLISADRTFWERGNDEAYSGEIYKEDLPLVDGEIKVEINVDDRSWYKKRKAQEEQFKGLGVFGEIGRISDLVTFSAMVSPRRQEDDSIAAVFGRNGEKMGGEHIRTSSISVFELEKTLKIPFNGR